MDSGTLQMIAKVQKTEAKSATVAGRKATKLPPAKIVRIAGLALASKRAMSTKPGAENAWHL